jgi:hypothetical protein
LRELSGLTYELLPLVDFCLDGPVPEIQNGGHNDENQEDPRQNRQHPSPQIAFKHLSYRSGSMMIALR